MSRRYPLDPPPQSSRSPRRSDHRTSSRPGLAIRSASAAAHALLEYLEYRRRHADMLQVVSGLLLLALGVGLAASAAITDGYLHRGVESGVEQPYVVQPTGKNLATNIDLRLFPAERLESVTQTLAGAGFRYVRQSFSWAQIEPVQGELDWNVYDQVIEHLDRRQIGVIAVVTETPEWAIGDAGSEFADAPPRDPATLQAFTQALTNHYGEAVPFVQIWDEPNISSNWGGAAATGETFLPYLAAGFNGARAGNASARVIAPELAISSDLAAGSGDLQFVRDLYRSAGRSFFDILGVKIDGGGYSPDDRRAREERANLSRAILFRDMMLEEGDGSTPIWATSYGWATSDTLSRDQQAEFVVRGMERSWSEWPWMGLMVHWTFLASEQTADSAYSVVLPDGTPTPLYRRLVSSAVTERANRANTGFAPMDSDAVDYDGDWQDQHLENRTFKTTSQIDSSTTFKFQGTGLIMFVRSGPNVGAFTLEIDGEIVPGGSATSSDQWDFSQVTTTNDFPRTVATGLADREHVATVTLKTPGELTLGGFVVAREPPFVWPIILMTVSSMIVLFFALRSFAYLVAIKTGHLRRRELIEPWLHPRRLPDWRPGQ